MMPQSRLIDTRSTQKPSEQTIGSVKNDYKVRPMPNAGFNEELILSKAQHRRLRRERIQIESQLDQTAVHDNSNLSIDNSIMSITDMKPLVGESIFESDSTFTGEKSSLKEDQTAKNPLGTLRSSDNLKLDNESESESSSNSESSSGSDSESSESEEHESACFSGPLNKQKRYQ